MSTIQKAFTFIVLVLALLAASVNLVLFAQRTNWKAEAGKVTDSLKDTQQQLAKLEAEKASQESVANAKILELQTRANALSDDLKNSESTLANERAVRGVQEQIASELKAKLEIIGQNMAAMDKRTGELSEAKDAAETKLAEVKAAAQTAEEQLVIANRVNKDLSVKVDSLTEQLAARDARVKTLEKRVDALSVYAPTLSETMADTAGAPPIYGKVTRLAKDGTAVYVSIGEDDGVTEGTSLLIYKANGTYIATAKVYHVGADQAAARLLPPVVGTVMEGDNVTNR